jgi:hypothetical protein
LSSSSYRCRRPSIDFGEDGVEPSKAAEAGPHGDLSHWESGFVEQPFRSLHAPRLGNLNRACAQVFLKEAIEVSCSDTKTPRQRLDTVHVQRTARDQTERPLDGCARPLPGRRKRRGFRSTPQAWSKACGFACFGLQLANERGRR